MELFLIPLKHNDGYQPMGMSFNKEECIGWSGLNVCDLCNEDICTEEHPLGYMIVPLGTNAICKNCYESFIKRRKLYDEDRHAYESMYKNIMYYYNNFNLEKDKNS